MLVRPDSRGAVDDAMQRLSEDFRADHIALDAENFVSLPAEVALRLLGRAIAGAGGQAAIRLGKLESLYEALRQARSRLRRTLAGALITLDRDYLRVERAPARRRLAMRGQGKSRFTK